MKRNGDKNKHLNYFCIYDTYAALHYQKFLYSKKMSKQARHIQYISIESENFQHVDFLLIFLLRTEKFKNTSPREIPSDALLTK